MCCDQGCGVGVGAGVGVGRSRLFFPESESESTKFTDSDQLRASSYSRFTEIVMPIIWAGFAHIFVVDWLDDKYRTKPCAVLHSRDGNRSKFRTQTQPVPDIWNVPFCSGRGISPFCNRVWALGKTIWTVTLAISRAPALGALDNAGSNIVFLWSSAIAKRVPLW